ncbi:type 1 glutamine amidotransferase domain-containing protein [Periweissella fabalis]|uniref:Type 1 glutamine amidotransferase n=1 Tax=Periweissella fabalis TaxID=1070421 RepID=A0A7X6N3N7_9LACO|nr:type 1 glutamine amidotransferase domain-containing protein [Periweissella fabalis]MCM0598132.1 type 1 glutamine amidotransferase [Periweissella fabalis]NKZ24744.1 type 1 glutamine amidotransferase [Periweissella fabalis]
MAKIIAIATDDFEDSELTSPKEALEAAGHVVDIVENEAGKTITGKHGATFETVKGIDNAKLSDYDALLIPGGFSPDKLRVDERYVKLTKEFLEANKPVFTICHGPQLFIQTGISDQLTLTAYQSVQADLKYAGANVKDEEVVIDDKHQLISSRTPKDLPAFNAAIVEALNK